MSNGREQKPQIVPRERGTLGLPEWPSEMERFFDRAMRNFGPWPWRRWGRWPRLWRDERWLPETDIFQREGKMVVRMDLPGVKLEDIDVAIEDDTLVIRGQRREEREVKEEDYYCTERAVGEFSRAVRLPRGASTEGLEATYREGVLEVSVPWPSAPEAKKVPIQVQEKQ